MNAERAMIWGNMTHRPLRTVITVLAVALQICLMVIVVGLVTGLVQEAAKRIEGIGADLMLQPPTSSFLTSFSGAPMTVKFKNVLEDVPHVSAVAPVLVQFAGTGGLNLIYGIDLESFRGVSGGFVYHQGGPFRGRSDVLVDDRYAAAAGLQVGDSMRILENDFTVRGIIEHGKGARLFIPIERLQEMMAARDMASLFYIRCDDHENTELVAEEIRKVLPRHKLQFVREYRSMLTTSSLPGLDTFVRSMIFLSVGVGFLVIFLAMYTIVLQRTRDVGILKSLGASKTDIIRLVMRESFLLCALGVGVGIGLSYGGRYIIVETFPTLTVLITLEWVAKAAVLGLVGGILGAIYPAWLASRQDAIVALAYE